MDSPIDIFIRGTKDGTFPGGQLAASREGVRLADCAAGVLGPGLGSTREDVHYDLASLTKPLATAVLLSRMFELEVAAPDDPIARWISGVDTAIRLFHLLEHSSGYPAHRRFDLALPSDVRPGTWDACRTIVDLARDTSRERRPGEKAEYSDVGFILLGAAIEAMMKLPLSTAFAALDTGLEFRDRRGFPAREIAIDATTFAPTEGCDAGEANDENCRAMGGAAGHAGLFGAARGVLAIAEDLVAAYHGARGRLLEPETVRRSWEPSAVVGSTRTLGWDRPSLEGSSTGGRWPRNSVGHLGYTGTSLWIEPERALIVVLVTNRVCPRRDNDRIRALRPALYDAAWEHWSK